MSEEDELYTEQRVADSIGVPRSEVKRVRDGLQEGKHWMKIRNRIVLTQEGLDSLMCELCPAGGESNGSKGQEIVVWQARRAVVRIEKIPRNPKIVEGRIVEVSDGPASEGPPGPRSGPVIGQVVRVRVKSSQNFIPGMDAPVYREAWDVWVLDRPCPRFRGRW